MPKNQVDRKDYSSPKEQSGREKNLFVQVPLEVLEAGISTSALKLYLILLKYARQSNECWPSQQTLGWDMNLKPRRIADLLKELECASLITIICRAKEGLSNLYRLLKVVPPKGGSNSSLPKTADSAAEKDLPGKQKKAGEGMQDSADESHEVEIHALKTHTHIQPAHVNGVVAPTNLDFDQPAKSVCDFRNSGKDSSDKSASMQSKEVPGSIHIPPQTTLSEKVIAVLTEFGVSEARAKQLAVTVIKAKLDDEYVRGLAEWILEQTASRTIYNPAGLLVQMVHQLAPVPLPRGAGVPTLNSLQLEADQRKEYFDKHLPRLIAIEERNLADAVSVRDKTSIRLRLDKYLALQAKESERAYPVGKPNLPALSANYSSQAFFMEQS
ncbi:MAG: helix-turn-helix domain-containing protein [Chloroflexi bacterium]|nr:helix-turn-helix domain-containing protein [Chloroflexota bacterium]MBN9396922.1 helix-turn-helix domain-containing protein [Candidatus Melainabacteria bacterium]OJV92959.1 MAG: hypothetical protein BGO39_03315 [Chloroflexi bacterium 54-19]